MKSISLLALWQRLKKRSVTATGRNGQRDE